MQSSLAQYLYVCVCTDIDSSQSGLICENCFIYNSTFLTRAVHAGTFPIGYCVNNSEKQLEHPSVCLCKTLEFQMIWKGYLTEPQDKSLHIDAYLGNTLWHWHATLR